MDRSRSLFRDDSYLQHLGYPLPQQDLVQYIASLQLPDDICNRAISATVEGVHCLRDTYTIYNDWFRNNSVVYSANTVRDVFFGDNEPANSYNIHRQNRSGRVRSVFIKAGQGLSKTRKVTAACHQMLRDGTINNALFICSRVSHGRQMFAYLNELGVETGWYQSMQPEDVTKFEAVVIQVDSLPKFLALDQAPAHMDAAVPDIIRLMNLNRGSRIDGEVPTVRFGMVVLDEPTPALFHWFASTVRMQLHVVDVMTSVIAHAEYFAAMESDMSDAFLLWALLIRDPADARFSWNTHCQTPKHIKFVNDDDRFMSLLLHQCQSGMRVFIGSDSKRKLMCIVAIVCRELGWGDNVIKTYTAESSDADKDALSEVDTVWASLDCVATSPTIVYGLSFAPASPHFHSQFFHFCKHSITGRNAFQQINRVRATVTGDVFVRIDDEDMTHCERAIHSLAEEDELYSAHVFNHSLSSMRRALSLYNSVGGPRVFQPDGPQTWHGGYPYQVPPAAAADLMPMWNVPLYRVYLFYINETFAKHARFTSQLRDYARIAGFDVTYNYNAGAEVPARKFGMRTLTKYALAETMLAVPEGPYHEAADRVRQLCASSEDKYLVMRHRLYRALGVVSPDGLTAEDLLTKFALPSSLETEHLHNFVKFLHGVDVIYSNLRRAGPSDSLIASADQGVKFDMATALMFAMGFRTPLLGSERVLLAGHGRQAPVSAGIHDVLTQLFLDPSRANAHIVFGWSTGWKWMRKTASGGQTWAVESVVRILRRMVRCLFSVGVISRKYRGSTQVFVPTRDADLLLEITHAANYNYGAYPGLDTTRLVSLAQPTFVLTEYTGIGQFAVPIHINWTAVVAL